MKVALVTGAVKRIGRSLAVCLAKRGYAVALHYHRSEEMAERTLAELKKYSPNSECFRADLSSAAEVADLIPRVVRSMGSADILINNVSVFNPPDFMRTTEEQFDYDMTVNFRTPFFLSQAFAKQVLGESEQNDRTERTNALIVNILDTRIAPGKVAKNYCVYTLGKQALHHLTRITARSLAPAIRVNALAPGPALPAPGASAADFDAVVRASPLRVPSPPESLAAGLGYLLDAKTVTGQVLYIDSGQHLS